MSARPHATAAARSASRARSWVRSSIVVMAPICHRRPGRSTGEGLRLPVGAAAPGMGVSERLARVSGMSQAPQPPDISSLLPAEHAVADVLASRPRGDEAIAALLPAIGGALGWAA